MTRRQVPAEALDAARVAALAAAGASKDREAASTVDVLMGLRSDMLEAAEAAGLEAGSVEILFQVSCRRWCFLPLPASTVDVLMGLRGDMLAAAEAVGCG